MTNPETHTITSSPEHVDETYKHEATPAARRALVSGTFGSALEWFDFAVYGALSATVLPQVFFKELSPDQAQIASFSTFAIGIVARPLGGLVFGYLGDRLGRRVILLTTFLLMGLSSTAIGLLPTVDTVGPIAALFLITLRFLQGFALGGEATGSQLLTMEHGPQDRRSFYGSLMAAGSPISQVMANTLLVVLSTVLSAGDFALWGWRIPFLISLLLVAVGIYIRYKVDESPVYEEKVEIERQEVHSPGYVLAHHGKKVLQLIVCYSPITLTFYLITVFGISYLNKNVGFTSSQTFTIMLVANLVSIVGVLWGGRLSDKFGRRNVLLIGAVGCLVFGLAFFPIANTRNLVATLLVVTAACFMAQFGNGAHAALFAEAFPTPARYQGSAFALTGVNLFFAAPAPMISSWFIGTFHSTLPLTLFWGLWIVIAIVVLLKTKDGLTLEGEPQTFRRLGALG